MPLASLMANGDAWDAITLRIVAAAASVTATRPRGGRSQEGEILVRTLMSFFRCLLCVLMGLLLCGGGACQGRGGRGDRGYTGRMHHWWLFATTIFAPPLSCSTTPASPTS